MITLTFRALNGESVMLVRGAYFRICADGTLRGPDNAVAASYTNGLWQLGKRRHRTLECREAVYLRVTTSDGQRECIGPCSCRRESVRETLARDDQFHPKLLEFGKLGGVGIPTVPSHRWGGCGTVGNGCCRKR